jgi:threonine dehydratase
MHPETSMTLPPDPSPMHRLRLAEIAAASAGAAGVAAILTQPERYRGARVAAIICGGNITRKQFAGWAIA